LFICLSCFIERRTLKDNGTPPPSALRTHNIKDARTLKHLEKEKAKHAYNSKNNGKPKT
jgi:hypothetical protein